MTIRHPRGYATALRTHLPQTVRVLDAFHVTRLGTTCVDDVHRRVQQHTTGHRGHRDDPLFGIRRVLRRRADRLTTRAQARLEAGLDAGDTDGQVWAAWLVAQHVTAIYTAGDPAAGQARVAAAIDIALDCPVPEVQRLGRTLTAWRAEISAYFTTGGASNGPVEAINLGIKNTLRTARGFRNFDNYKLRLLLEHGRLWHTPTEPRIRTRTPRFVA